MKYMSCRNCKHFDLDHYLAESFEVPRNLKIMMCNQPAAEGGTSVSCDHMLHNGPCGRRLKYWEKRIEN